MIPARTTKDGSDTVAVWALPYTATLGSSVRVKGILQEVRARLPLAARKGLRASGSELTLRFPDDAGDGAWAEKVSKALENIEALPVLPREIQDILSITTTERHRWLKDGRLPSAGTRTVKLRGRARKITFHVFDPRFVEDALDRDVVVDWREQDAATAAENRRRAAWKAKQKRQLKDKPDDLARPEAEVDEEGRPNLRGWDEWERTGLLR